MKRLNFYRNYAKMLSKTTFKGNKMKKVAACFFGILIVSITMLMGGCTFFDELFAPSDNEDADNKLQAFVEFLNNEDRDGIKALFARNKISEISNFDESVEELFAYYDGEYISVERHSTGVEEDKDGGAERKWYNMSYEVTTDAAIYRMAFYWCAKDTGDKGNVGIESFYIIKATDDPNYPQYSYGGDGLWTNGINVGKAHEQI